MKVTQKDNRLFALLEKLALDFLNEENISKLFFFGMLATETVLYESIQFSMMCLQSEIALTE